MCVCVALSGWHPTAPFTHASTPPVGTAPPPRITPVNQCGSWRQHKGDWAAVRSRQATVDGRQMGNGRDGCRAGCSWPFAHQTLCQTFVSNGQGRRVASTGVGGSRPLQTRRDKWLVRCVKRMPHALNRSGQGRWEGGNGDAQAEAVNCFYRLHWTWGSPCLAFNQVPVEALNEGPIDTQTRREAWSVCFCLSILTLIKNRTTIGTRRTA